MVRSYDNATLASAAYTVPVSQVTMTVSNGAAVNGSSVITLADNVGLSNTNLTVAMARAPAPDSATSEFFINRADNLGLNWTAMARGYAVFGHITTGANQVTTMKAAPCVAALVSECLPIPNLVIRRATQTQ